MKINNDVRRLHCPLCSSTRLVSVGDIDYISPVKFSTLEISLEKRPELWSCRNCRSGFTQNIIPERIASSLYEAGVGGERWSADNFEKIKNAEIIEVLEDVFQKNKSILDIGCNTGELLDFAKKRGCKTFGVEFSGTSRDILKKKGHITFSSIAEVDGYYNIITAFDLVEHLYSLPVFLTFCSQRLTSDGRLFILTGNISSISARIAGINWWYLKYPEHIQFISKKYFRSIPNFQIEHLVHTYASVGYKRSLFSLCKGFIAGLLKGRYQGLPSLGPDHILVALKK